MAAAKKDTKKSAAKKPAAKKTTGKKTTGKKAPAKKAAKSVFPENVTRDDLLALGDAINTVIFGGNDPMDYAGMEDKDLLDQILTDAKEIDPSDSFGANEKKTIAVLGVEIAWAGAEETEPKEEEEKEAENTPAAGEQEEEKPTPKKKEPAKKTAGKGKKSGTDKAQAKKSAAKKPAAKKADDGGEKYSRSHALVDALKDGGTRQEVVAHSNDLFMKYGGKDNMNVANYMFGYVVPSLIILGLLKKEDDDKTFVWIG